MMPETYIGQKALGSFLHGCVIGARVTLSCQHRPPSPAQPPRHAESGFVFLPRVRRGSVPVPKEIVFKVTVNCKHKGTGSQGNFRDRPGTPATSLRTFATFTMMAVITPRVYRALWALTLALPLVVPGSVQVWQSCS